MTKNTLIGALSLAALIPASLFAAETPAPAAPAKAPEAAKPAAPEKLDVGSPAPALAPARWFKGEPVTAFEKDKTYIIECWATWCGPCIAAIPHVNGLHNKFKDKGLVVIGVNVWDKNEAGAEKLVADKGDGMAYRVAYDGATANVAKNWLKPAGANGIPHAFVVRDNKILWQGHPAELEEGTVASMIAGTFDPAKMQAEADARKAAIVKYREVQQKLGGLVAGQKYAEALALLDSEKATFDALNPTEVDFRRGEIFAKQGDAPKALAALKIAAEKGKDNPGVLHRVSQMLLNTPGVTDNALALETAKLAAEKGDNHPVLVLCLAQAHYASGDKAAAAATLDKLAGEIQGKSARIEAAVAAAQEVVKTGAAWPANLIQVKTKATKHMPAPAPEPAKADAPAAPAAPAAAKP